MFWHDELFTVMVSRLSFADLKRALVAGVDVHPPMTHLLVKIVNATLGEGEVATRLPGMVGYWIFCLCVFWFVRHRLGILYGFSALFLPFSTGAYAYAFEARCYGVLLGFCGLVLVCWQAAAEGRRRMLTVPGIAFGMAGIMFSHYYGILIYLPFGGAELWRLFRRRSADLPVLAAFLAGLIPLVLCAPFWRNLGMQTGHSWAYPRLSGLYSFYLNELPKSLVPAMSFLVLTALYFRFGRPAAAPVEEPPSFPSHEVVAATIFMGLPAVCLAVAFGVTHYYADRYVISTITGFVVLTVYVVSRFARGNAVIGAILAIASAMPVVFELTLHQHESQTLVDKAPLLVRALQQGSVAIDDGTLFFQAWYYLPPELRPKVYYVADPEAAVVGLGFDTVDKVFLLSRPWISFRILDYQHAATPGASLLIYHSAANWLPNRLLRDGARIEVVASLRDVSILKATMPERR
jgi:Dolichyl-phosphate-mannose-protein mannosyltransferase